MLRCAIYLIFLTPFRIARTAKDSLPLRKTAQHGSGAGSVTAIATATGYSGGRRVTDRAADLRPTRAYFI
eukprot:12917185-Prorocentrum_lima.AAC.1